MERYGVIHTVRGLLRRRRALAAALGVLALGLLLWGRLLMTQSVPRTAIARPEKVVVVLVQPEPVASPPAARPGAPGADAAAAAVLADAKRLKLQRIVSGPRPHVVIDGREASPGGRIEGFEVVEVRPRSVTLRRESVTVRLEIRED